MTVHLVTFSDESMSRAAKVCLDSGEAHGASAQWLFTPNVIEQSRFYREHEALLSSPRGCGYWAWKPYIINCLLSGQRGGNPALPEGNILIYSDAGVEFINNVSHIIDRMDQDIFLFGNNWEHAHWCKADVVVGIWPGFVHNVDWTRFGKQCQASVIFFRVSDYSRKFVAEWLKWCLYRQRFSEGVCSDEWRYLIDDSPSILPNHPEFREHRHDQAILTTLAYREGIRLHYWTAQYNDGAFSYEKLPEYAQDSYPILFHHHRRRNHEWKNAA